MYINCKNPVFIEKNRGWYIDDLYNQIFEIDVLNNRVNYVDSYSASRLKDRAYRMVRKYGNELYIFPLCSKQNIKVYNLEAKSCVDINVSISNTEKYAMIAAWETYNNLVIYCQNPNKMLEISMGDKKVIKCHDIRYEELMLGKFREKRNDVHWMYVNKNNLMEIDFELGRFIKHCTRKDIWAVVFTENLLWISTDTHILVYDKFVNKVNDFIPVPDYLLRDRENFINMDARVSTNYIWYIPPYTNEFIYIDKVSKKINILKVTEEPKNINRRIKYIIIFVWKDRFLYLYSKDRKKNFMIDMETAEYRDVQFEINDNDCEIVMEQHGLQSGECIWEYEDVNIRNLLVTNKYNSESIEYTNIDNKNIGNNIYFTVKG